MKNPSKKLQLRRQTLRTLGHELAHVAAADSGGASAAPSCEPTCGRTCLPECCVPAGSPPVAVIVKPIRP